MKFNLSQNITDLNEDLLKRTHRQGWARNFGSSAHITIYHGDVLRMIFEKQEGKEAGSEHKLSVQNVHTRHQT
jgi:hypothetical protein